MPKYKFLVAIIIVFIILSYCSSINSKYEREMAISLNGLWNIDSITVLDEKLDCIEYGYTGISFDINGHESFFPNSYPTTGVSRVTWQATKQKDGKCILTIGYSTKYKVNYLIKKLWTDKKGAYRMILSKDYTKIYATKGGLEFYYKKLIRITID